MSEFVLCLFDIFFTASNGDHVRIGARFGQVNFGVSFLADRLDGGATFTDDVFVELLENGHLNLKNEFKKVSLENNCVITVGLGNVKIQNLGVDEVIDSLNSSKYIASLYKFKKINN